MDFEIEKGENIFLMCIDCGCRDREILRAAMGTKGFRNIPVEGVKGQGLVEVKPTQRIVWSKFLPTKKLDPNGGDPLETDFLEIAAAHKNAGKL